MNFLPVTPQAHSDAMHPQELFFCCPQFHLWYCHRPFLHDWGPGLTRPALAHEALLGAAGLPKGAFQLLFEQVLHDW